MNKIGINLWNFIKEYTDENIGLIKSIAETGYTAVEIPMVNTEFNAELLASELNKYNLESTLCAVMIKGRDLSNDDGSVVENTKIYLKKCIDIANIIGSKIICGPLFAGGGKAHYLSAEKKAAEIDLAASSLREVAEYALEKDVSLAIEPINRYRTSVVNNVYQAAELVKNIDMPNVGILYDTYQANIEEANMSASLEYVLSQNMLLHFHVSDSNRFAPGMGHINFGELYEILKRYNYQGHLTMETFIPDSFDPVWTKPDKTQEEIALIGLNNIKLINRNK